MDKEEAYKILGVKENATELEIKKRWHYLNKQYHPDKSRHLSDLEIKMREDDCKKINEAYRILTK
jgi:DnaJ-class molecular chaperone